MASIAADLVVCGVQELLQELHTLASTVVHVFDWFETRAREAAASLQKQLR